MWLFGCFVTIFIFTFRDGQSSGLIGLPVFSSIFSFFVILMFLDLCVCFYMKIKIEYWILTTWKQLKQLVSLHTPCLFLDWSHCAIVNHNWALNFFSGRGVRPGFPKCGACELTFASEKGGLWAENFQIWRLVSWKFPNLGLVSWKFPNLGACELKFGWKLRLLRLKFPNFLKRGSCELTLLLEMGPLRAAGEAWKGGLQGRTSPYPLSRSVPPPGCVQNW